MPAGRHKDPNCQCCFCKSKRGETNGQTHPMYGNVGKDNPNYGSKRTQKTKDRMSRNHADVSGKNNPCYRRTGSKNPMFGRTRDKHPLWKGNEYRSNNGRWTIWVNGIKYCKARYVAEQCLQRKLTKEEIVHHINEDPSDDRPENLYVFATKSQHTRQHKLKNPPTFISNLIN